MVKIDNAAANMDTVNAIVQAGIPIWPQLREMGVKEPQSLEEWADVSLGSNHLPWLQGEDLRRLSEMLEYFMLDTRRSLLTGQELNRGLQEVC